MTNVVCGICKKVFYAKPSHIKLGWGKYCSMLCRNKSQILGKSVKCSVCNNEAYRSPAQLKHSKSGKFFCSKSCQTKWRNSYFVEEKHPNWTNGISAYRDILKRSKVAPICYCCKTEDLRILMVHHIDHNRQNNKLSNLIWVCLNCHYLIHNYESFEESLRK